MHGSATPGWLLMALSAATGAYCLLRLRSSSPGARTAAGSEAVMGFGMAAMALPAAVAPPPPGGGRSSPWCSGAARCGPCG